VNRGTEGQRYAIIFYIYGWTKVNRIIRLIAMETNDFGTSIERVKQTVNYVSYAHVCMIRLFKAILNNDDH
jgi:hypothetical protein